MCTMYITHSQKFFSKKCNGLSHHEWTCGKHAQVHHRHHQLLHSFPAHDTQGKKAWQTGNGKANETHTHTTHIRERWWSSSCHVDCTQTAQYTFQYFFPKFHPTLPFPTRLSFLLYISIAYFVLMLVFQYTKPELYYRAFNFQTVHTIHYYTENTRRNNINYAGENVDNNNGSYN